MVKISHFWRKYDFIHFSWPVWDLVTAGLKQIDPFTKHGEFIIDFSIYDAIKAGFNKVVFVIKEENYEAFKETVGHRIEKKVDVEYVFQKLDSFVPADKLLPERVKPWGTTQALLCAKDALKEGFAVINADDFYGRDAFMKAAEFIKNADTDAHHYCMVGYLLGNTLTDNGSVARGVCHKDETVCSIKSLREQSSSRKTAAHTLKKTVKPYTFPTTLLFQ